MTNKHIKNIRPSMLIEGFRFISIYYFSIAILVTLTQLYIEFNLSRNTIFDSIERLHSSFEASLSNALWEFNDSQIDTILKGILESPAVTGVELTDSTSFNSKRLGNVPDQIQFNKSNSWFGEKFSPDHLYQFKFTLHKEFEENRIEQVGELKIYTGNHLLFNQIERTILFILVSSIVKTIILWIILWLFFKSKLKKPIQLLIRKIEDIDPQDPTMIETDLKVETQEIFQIVKSFNSLALEVKNYKDILEALLENKTEELKEKSIEVRNLILKLEDAQGQIINQEKLNSLGLVSAGIAHELKNPLNLTKNATLILEERWIDHIAKNPDPKRDEEREQVTNLIKIINHNNERMETIIKSMLLQSRYEQDTLVKINLQSFVDVNFIAALKSLKTESSQKCEYIIDISKDLYINVFPSELGRLLVNLYENSFYAIDEKYHLERDKTKEYIPKIVTTAKKLGNNTVNLTVMDNGVGIPSKIKNKVLEPFFTTKPTGKGTGLGLYLVYEIVRKHRGTLKIQSTEGEYTEFVINLPE